MQYRGGYHDACGGYLDYRGGVHYHGDIISTMGGGGVGGGSCLQYRGGTMMHVGIS